MKRHWLAAGIASLAIVGSAQAFPVTYSYSGPDVFIGNYGWKQIKIYVADNYVIDDVNVQVNMDHTWVGDVSMWVQGPDSNPYDANDQMTMLVDQIGRPEAGPYGYSSNGFHNTRFNDQASRSISDAAANEAPFTGDWKVADHFYNGAANNYGDLADYNGMSTKGTWTLWVRDWYTGADCGYLRDFQLQIQTRDGSPGGDPVPEPATLTLFGMGLLGAGRVLRRRKK